MSGEFGGPSKRDMGLASEGKREIFGNLMESANADEEKQRIAFAHAVLKNTRNF